jgi:tricorn protease
MKRLSLALAATVLASASFAQTSVSFPRYPGLSPDGKTLVFSYQGDLWISPTEGGAPARRLTSHPAYDGRAQFSPDGKEIGFQSLRYGRNEAFVMPANGGPARRLTNYGGGNGFQGWAAGGKKVLISSVRELTRRGQTLYTVNNSDKPGRPIPVLGLNNLIGGQLSPDGTKLVFSRGATDWPRIGYRGSANADIWVYDLTTKEFKQLTEFDGQDMWPLWMPDSKNVVFVSERDGAYNLYKISASGGKATQLTKYVGEGVRFPTVSADGSRAAFEVGDRIETVALTGAASAPKMVTLAVAADDKSNPVENLTLSSGASEVVPSGDGEQVGFVVRGDVFAAPATGGKAVRLTDGPQREGDLAWSPDGKTLIYVKDGDFYALTSTDTDEPKLSKSLKRSSTRLTSTASPESSPHFSPDGKKLAYVRGKGELVVSDADGKNDKVVIKVLNLQELNWSPDGKWLTYSAEDEEFNSEIFVLSLEPGSKPINVSRHPRNDYAPSFSPDGGKLIWMSERSERQFDIFWVYLKKDDDERTVDGWQRLKEKKKPAGPPTAPPTAPTLAPPNSGAGGGAAVAVDAEGIHERTRRLTASPGNEVGPVVTASPDGSTLVAFSAGPEIQLAVIADGAPSQPPRRMAAGGGGLTWAKGTLFYLAQGGTIAAASPAAPEARPVAFRAKLTADKRELQKAVFEEAWEVMNQVFYDPKFHGADWPALREKYRPMAAAASDPMDFYDVIRLLMGHLNSSHIGITPGIISDGGATPIPTGLLGTIWDESYSGPGLKVARVLKSSPADRAESKLLPGEVILAIGGTTLTADTNPDELLADTVGEKLPLTVKGTDGKEREVLIVPAATTAVGSLLYDDWTSSRQELTHKLSGGKLAYLHIQGMDKLSQDKFEAGLYAEAYGRDALLIDVRDNGGGSTADYLLTMLSQPRHAYTIARDGAPGYPTDRLPYYPWRKPAGLLINENSYSNAEIFAHAFKQLDRGPIFGIPTFGAVVSTGAASLLDGSQIRTPGRGWYRVSDGVNEEHTGAEPDTRVEISLADELAGRDPQLEAAVKALMSKAKPAKLPEAKPGRLSTSTKK